MARKRTLVPSTGGGDISAPVAIEDEEQVVNLEDIPLAGQTSGLERGGAPQQHMQIISSDSDRETRSDSKLPASREHERPKSKDDKKIEAQMAYDGFAIWGWVLCLLITRRSTGNAQAVKAQKSPEHGSALPATTSEGQTLMEEWISTQTPQDLIDGN